MISQIVWVVCFFLNCKDQLTLDKWTRIRSPCQNFKQLRKFDGDDENKNDDTDKGKKDDATPT